MARHYGDEYPERPLMATISDLLGIDHYSTSRGSTVRRDFLEGVATRLGVDPMGGTKDDLLRRVWEYAYSGERMPDDRLVTGGTVTNLVLQEIIDGLSSRLMLDVHPTSSALTFEVDAETVSWSSEGLADTRTRMLREVAVREGQDKFRTAVLTAYGGKCAATSCATPTVLQAAHIMPYRGTDFNNVQNGIALRADIHLLFDRGAIAIHEVERLFLVSSDATALEYAHLHGQKVRVPSSRDQWPSTDALRAHRRWARL